MALTSRLALARRRTESTLLRFRIVRAFLAYSHHRGGLLSAAITFRMLFAVFAGVYLGFSFVSNYVLSRDDFWVVLVETVDAVIPGLVAMDGSALVDVSHLPDIRSSFAAPILSTAVLLWALLGGVANVRMSIRSIAGTRHERSNVALTRAVDLLFALSLGVLILVSAVVSFLGSTFVDSVLGWFGTSAGGSAEILTRLGTVAVTFLLDAVIIAWLFWLLSGRKAAVSQIAPGALLGGAGLVVLQQLSGLFLGGVDNNPLLATFSSLVALLLWFNLSAQVTLVACAYIVMTIEEAEEGPERGGQVTTFKKRKVVFAEQDLRVAKEALEAARVLERDQREKTAPDSRPRSTAADSGQRS